MICVIAAFFKISKRRIYYIDLIAAGHHFLSIRCVKVRLIFTLIGSDRSEANCKITALQIKIFVHFPCAERIIPIPACFLYQPYNNGFIRVFGLDFLTAWKVYCNLWECVFICICKISGTCRCFAFISAALRQRGGAAFIFCFTSR